MPDWLTTEMLNLEITQREEEGCVVADLRARAAGLGPSPTTGELLSLWAETEVRTPRPDFPYWEPSDLPSIRQARPEGPRKIYLSISREQLYDKIYGGWLGRAAGCMLGKPVEGWKRQEIHDLLSANGEYPLEDYFRWQEKPPIERPFHRFFAPNWGRGNIDRMPRDDDMDYPVLGLKLLETKGLDFTTSDVASLWLCSLPYTMVYTAERVAYRNLVLGLQPPASAAFRNPYREWIGAQIRGDIFGWATPGRLEYAAELAYRDACLSHVKNGIYGEMLISAMLAAAFTTDNVEEIIRLGLSEIPQYCRLAEAVRNTVQWSKEEPDWERTLDRILATYGHYHGVHTINNAAIVVMALMYSRGELEPAITRAVMAGEDTDCNGATVGSIVGVLNGARGLASKWISPFNDRLESIVVGYTDNRLSDLAERTLKAGVHGNAP